MEQLLRAELRTATLRAFASPGGGYISEGRAYDTDAGPVFVKVNHRAQVRVLERGEEVGVQRDWKEGKGGKRGRRWTEWAGRGEGGGVGDMGQEQWPRVAPTRVRPSVTAPGVSLWPWSGALRVSRAPAFPAGSWGFICCRISNSRPFTCAHRVFSCLT